MFVCARARLQVYLLIPFSGLFTEIAVCKFLWRSYGPKPFHLVHFCSFCFSSSCKAHCAFDQGSCAIAKCPVVVVVKDGVSCRGSRNANILNAAKSVDSVSVHECSHFSREVLLFPECSGRPAYIKNRLRHCHKKLWSVDTVL